MDIRAFLISLVMASAFILLLVAPGEACAGESGRARIFIKPLQGQLQGSDADDPGSHRMEKVARNASALTEALIRELDSRGVTTYRIGEHDPAPQSGWVVTGVFKERVPKGLIFGALRSFGSSTPNTEVDVSVSRAGSDPNQPARLIDTAASLGGQGSALSLNPYEAAAKLVVHHVASDRSIGDLARRIADQILAEPSGVTASAD